MQSTLPCVDVVYIVGGPGWKQKSNSWKIRVPFPDRKEGDWDIQAVYYSEKLLNILPGGALCKIERKEEGRKQNRDLCTFVAE